MGARPLRRAIQRYIEDPLADFVLRSELEPQATVLVDKAAEGEEQELSLSIIKPEKPVPAAVGGKSDQPEEDVDDGGALDQPAVDPAPPADE
jgi:ATP-dependent Clp protease ATP-binding subunit ClpC